MREPASATPDLATFQRAVMSLAKAMAPALGQITAAFKAMAGAYAETYERIIRQSLPYRRAFYGGNGSDALDPLWQSAVCSAWLHESCPDKDGSLQCTCACHH